MIGRGDLGVPGTDLPARFVPGDRVITRTADPDHHTRLPRYARGHVGEVVEIQGIWPLPDDRAQGNAAPGVEPVYTVRFAAADPWGSGGHEVTVDLWQSYLDHAPAAGSAEEETVR
jgi:nitrile hydratase